MVRSVEERISYPERVAGLFGYALMRYEDSDIEIFNRVKRGDLGWIKELIGRDELAPDHLKLRTYGNPEVVKLIAAKEKNPHRKIALLNLGGGQAGVIGVGISLGMAESDVMKNIDGIISISAGIPTCMYIETGQGEEGTQIPLEDNTREGHIVKVPKDPVLAAKKIYNYWKKGPNEPLFDTQTVADTMRYTRPLDLEKFRESDKELTAVVMDVKSGKPVFVDLKRAKDPIDVMAAGICIPGVSSYPSVKLEDGNEYADAAFVEPLPLQWVFDQGYTDVLVVANTPIKPNGGWLESLFPLMLSTISRHPEYGYSSEVIKGLKRAEHTNAKAYGYLDHVLKSNLDNRRVAVIEPGNSFLTNIIETNPEVLKRALTDAKNFSKIMFTQPEITTPWFRPH